MTLLYYCNALHCLLIVIEISFSKKKKLNQLCKGNVIKYHKCSDQQEDAHHVSLIITLVGSADMEFNSSSCLLFSLSTFGIRTIYIMNDQPIELYNIGIC